jgi:hypothetical protein
VQFDPDHRGAGALSSPRIRNATLAWCIMLGTAVTGATRRPDVDTLRNRLNMRVLVVPGQFLTLVAVYWLRFVPAFRPFAFEAPAPPLSVLLACAAALLVPFGLPRGWFRPRAFERGRLYPTLGLRLAFNVYPVLHQRYKRARLRSVVPNDPT